MYAPRRSRLRASALLSAGALSLHELRYLVGWGARAQQALAGQGHAYLSYAMPLAVGLAAAGLGQLLLRLGREPSDSTPARSRVMSWLGASAALLAIFVTQETLEGLLGDGRPSGLAGVFGHGGLVAIPLALALGALISLGERGARAALAAPSRLGHACRGLDWPERVTAPGARSRSTPSRPGAAAGELALRLSGRAPPPAFR